MRAFRQYYLTLLLFNGCFTAASGVFGNFMLLPSIFCTAGFAFSLFAFNTFFSRQYYFYNNIGFTRQKLAVMAFAVNLVPAAIIFAISLIFI